MLSPALWILLIFSMMGSEVTLATYGAELFPTSQRSTAAGVRSALRDGGGILGLALEELAPERASAERSSERGIRTTTPAVAE